MSKKSDYEKRTKELAMPILDENGFYFYDVEYVREAGENYLRLFVDKDGGITIDDVVLVTREMNELLDKEDFISDAYIFEVSSPGVERVLKWDFHYEAAMERPVKIKLYKAISGTKELFGTLCGFSENDITIRTDETTITIDRADIAIARMAFVND